MARGGGSRLPYLISLVDRYGEEVEADLHAEYRLDLLDFFRGAYSWRKLHALVKRLPQSSRLAVAMADDDELVKGLDLSSLKGRGGRPPLAGYSPEAQRLDNVVDAVNALTRVVLQVVGERPPPAHPVTRPETALTRAERAASEARLGSLVDEVAEAQARAEAAQHN